MYQISVVNRTRTVSDLELHRVVRAVNRQIAEDFAPYWAFGGNLRVEGPARGRIDTNALLEMRGDAVLYLLDSASSDDALGYHDRNMQGVPYGFVYLDLCAQLGDPWSATLSHEALELIADPQCNLLVKGPNPRGKRLPDVYHYFEMCDAVQAQVYEIDSVPVSNFVLPAYFTPNESEGTRKDFSGSGLRPFEVNPGGYIGYFDPNKAGGADADTFFADDRSRERHAIKTGTALPDSERPRGRVARRQAPSVDPRATIPAAVHDIRLRHTLAAGAVNGADMQVDPIRHVVVLMLENRSFDHLLGGLQGSIPGLDGVDPLNPGKNVDAADGGKEIFQKPVAEDVVSKAFNVPHEFGDIQLQLKDGNAHFVDNFVKHNPKASAFERQQVMAYFKEGDLNVMHTLAKNYLVCNRWFSSLPGPTWPNRLFAHSGTCLGHVLMPDADNPAEIDQLWGTFRQDTIYDRLDDARVAGKPVSWRIYHDGFPQSVILDKLKWPFLSGRYSAMEDFFEDAQAESSFPAYSFIEPRYANGAKRENDQHPPASMEEGEQLIASVYNAIRGNEALWRSTLLIVTHDEHGGFYDHVVPPAAIPPDASPSEFAFDRLGVRVPTILISPFVEAGVDNTVYDHTSILRYVLEKYQLPPLGERTRPSQQPGAVGTFAPRIRSRAREDTLPPFETRQARRGAIMATTAKPVVEIAPDNTRRALLAVAERMLVMDQLTRRGSALRAVATHLPATTPTEPKEFTRRMESVDAWLAARAPGATPPPLGPIVPAARSTPAERSKRHPLPAAAPRAPVPVRAAPKGAAKVPLKSAKRSAARKKPEA
ncbi:MAG TPA: alkaline phosphatase family protein [Telluria sp.]|nr:alkaline phosphatase family protein [Telluria sp.]